MCAGDTTLLSTVAVTGASYEWLRNNIPVTGATSPSLTISASGLYTVKRTLPTTSGPCVLISQAVSISVDTLPAPVITVASPVLSTGTFSTYQWLFNGSPLAGATTSSYTAVQDGSYQVWVSTAAGCSDTSDQVMISGLSLPSINSKWQSFSVFPNPTKGRVHIQGVLKTGTLSKTVDLDGIDVLGRIVFSKAIQTNANRIDAVIDLDETLPFGIYFFQDCSRIRNSSCANRIAQVISYRLAPFSS